MVFSFSFTLLVCYVNDQVSGRVLLLRTLHDGIYSFNLSIRQPQQPKKDTAVQALCSISPLSSSLSVLFVSLSSDLNLWHRRLGHPSLSVVKSVLCSHTFHVSINNDFQFCNSCAMGKVHGLPFSESSTVYITPLQLIVSDLWGSTYIPPINGYRYYISFVDAFS